MLIAEYIIVAVTINNRKKTMAKERKEMSISFDGIGVCVTPEEDITTRQKAAPGKRGVVAVVTAEQIRRERYFELMARIPFGPHVAVRQNR
jgi:hypothetical protein